MINILKLCDGLRNSGFSKYADEVENKFIGYKRADNSLYDVSKETGEKLLETAHPEGSHQLEGLDVEESIVEDILDKHLKILKVVEKTPLGKSSSSLDIINAVKVVLADTTLTPVNLVGQSQLPIPEKLTSLMTAVQDEVKGAIAEATNDLNNKYFLSRFTDDIYKYAKNPTLSNLKLLSETISKLIFRLKPGVVGVDQDSFDNIIEPNLTRALSYVNQALPIRLKYEQQLQILKSRDQANIGNDTPMDPSVTLQSSLYTGWLTALNKALQNLTVWSQTIPIKNIKPSTKTNMLKWVTEQTALLTKYKNTMESAPAESKDEVVGQLYSEMKKELDFVDQFKKQLSGM